MDVFVPIIVAVHKAALVPVSWNVRVRHAMCNASMMLQRFVMLQCLKEGWGRSTQGTAAVEGASDCEGLQVLKRLLLFRVGREAHSAYALNRQRIPLIWCVCVIWWSGLQVRLGLPATQWISVYNAHRPMKQRYHYNVANSRVDQH
eukprot:1160850-Pelagomonas_calceolata.AAC.1